MLSVVLCSVEHRQVDYELGGMGIFRLQHRQHLQFKVHAPHRLIILYTVLRQHLIGSPGPGATLGG